MPISSGGPPKINSRPYRPVGQIPVQQLLQFYGQKFRIQPIPVTLDLFTSLGFNPRRFAEGATIINMEPAEFERYSETCGFDKAAGLYPMGMNGDQAAVERCELPYLPNRSRNVVLPVDHETITLSHELLHDIFLGGGIEARDRHEFIGNVLHWYRLSVDKNMPHQHKNRSFYEKVAKVCAEKYDIGTIDPRYNFGAHQQERDFQIFAGECFAYAGEFLLHSQDSILEAIPKEIVRFFKFIRLFDRSVYQRANEQA